MRTLVILGGGTAGTMAANKLRDRLEAEDWRIVVVDKDDNHDYQPAYLFVPFGINKTKHVRRARHAFIDDGIELLMGEVDRVDPEGKQVHLLDGRELDYDYLVIATGTTPRPDQTPGMLGPEWRKSVHDFYTYEGMLALKKALKEFRGGRLVMHITEMPIKCPVAPLEFTFLADAYFTEQGLRDIDAR